MVVQDKKTNMYKDAIFRWNVGVGCEFDCSYCRKSFQAQMKRQMPKYDKNGKWRGCQECYDYTPHLHPERLKRYKKDIEGKASKYFPKTYGDQFIWACSSGDIYWFKPEWLKQIVDIIKENPDRTFFMQTKNPIAFYSMKIRGIEKPSNLEYGITLETNRDEGYEKISKAPKPSIRKGIIKRQKITIERVTIEPITDFDLEILTNWVRQIGPKITYVGYDTKKCKLDEPTLEKTLELIEELEEFTKVKLKFLREKWDRKLKPILTIDTFA